VPQRLLVAQRFVEYSQIVVCGGERLVKRAIA